MTDEEMPAVDAQADELAGEIKPDPEPDQDVDDVIDEELDPEFAMFLDYVEATARRAVKEIRESIVIDSPDDGLDEDEDEEEAREPDPGTDEYDVRNGIPAYEFD